MIFHISACGKLVLTGELAVLFKKKANCISVNKNLTLKVSLTDFSLNPTINITSKRYSLQVDKNNLEHFLKKNKNNKDLKIIIFFIQKLINFNYNLNIEVVSQIPPGLGSSGALILNFTSLEFLLKKILNNPSFNIHNNKNNLPFKFKKNFIKFSPEDKKEIFRKASLISKKIHSKYTSFIDIASSLYGNLIFYRKNKVIEIIEKKEFQELFKEIYLIKIGNSQRKISTKQSLNIIKNQKKTHEIEEIFYLIGKKSEEFFKIFKKEKDKEKIIKILNENEDLLEKLGLLDEETLRIKNFFLKNNIKNFKISGSGFGDYAFSLDENIEKIKPLASKERIKISKIKIGKPLSMKIFF